MQHKKKPRRLEIYKSLKTRPSINDEFMPNDNQAIQRGVVFGNCLMCGSDVLFLVKHANLRETLECPVCLSYNRQRQLIAALSMELYGKIYDLKTVINKMKKGSRILLLESVTNLAEAIQYYAGSRVEVVTTEYISDDLNSGQTGSSGVMHLDIHNAHFPNDHFDVIIHADVFEHVADAPTAEAEQVRILKKNGSIVYTAPFHPNTEEDDVRAVVEKGKLKLIEEPIYHGDPAPRDDKRNNSGCLVFRIFSYPETLSRHSAIGADFSCHHLYLPEYGIIGNNAYVFSVSK